MRSGEWCLGREARWRVRAISGWEGMRSGEWCLGREARPAGQGHQWLGRDALRRVVPRKGGVPSASGAWEGGFTTSDREQAEQRKLKNHWFRGIGPLHGGGMALIVWVFLIFWSPKANVNGQTLKRFRFSSRFYKNRFDKNRLKSI
jgi:hypothetical protein